MSLKKRSKASGSSEKPTNLEEIEEDKHSKSTNKYEYLAENWLLQSAPDSERTYKILNYLVTAIGLIVRFWSISEPREVVFDEVHFGKFASYYLQRTYFFDVHPPLAKMMIAAVGWLVGYDGSFKFDDIGYSYDTYHAPFIAYRSLSAILGILTIPVVFQTMKELNFKAITLSLIHI